MLNVPVYICVLNKTELYWRLFFSLKTLFTLLKHSQLKSICFLPLHRPPPASSGTKLSLLFLCNYSFPWGARFKKGKLVAKDCGAGRRFWSVRVQRLPETQQHPLWFGQGNCTHVALHLVLLLKRLPCTQFCLVRFRDMGWPPRSQGALDEDH